MITEKLQHKLNKIKSGQYKSTDFIIADAKDADMAFGIAAPGPAANGTHYKTREDYLTAMSAMAESELIDILLMSASSAEALHSRNLFKQVQVTPAVRLNDTTDIWSARGSNYRESPSMPFATADLDAIKGLCQLGLYSITFSNNLKADKATLESYRDFG